ncbi:MAG: protocatechuate 3,4-dioxygenase subunit alpha [Solirubrobacteraceae bacterium]
MQSPSQTSGPLFGFALIFDGCEEAVPPGSHGAVEITGVVLDGAGAPVNWPECFLEFWEGEQWARTRTDEEGLYRVVVRKPDPQPMPDGSVQAPHLNVVLFARGLLKQALTRVYFPDETDANAADPVLEAVPEHDRELLVAVGDGDHLRFDIHLQGENETPFFAF